MNRYLEVQINNKYYLCKELDLKNMNAKFGIYIEYLWVAIALFSLASGLYQWYNADIEQASVFLMMLFVAILMYNFRRRMRIKANKKNNG